MAENTSLREDTEIQGDVLAGFKKDHVTLLMIHFTDQAPARAWLADTTPRIANTRQVAAFNEAFSQARRCSGGDDPDTLKATWLGLSFTYPGLRFLTGRDDLLPEPPSEPRTTLDVFVQGPVARARDLGDVDDSDPKCWEFGCAAKQVVHAVLTIAADTRDDLTAALDDHRRALSRAGALIAYEQPGATLPGGRRGREHFGFKDGVSEPGVAGFDEEDPQRKGYAKDHPGTRLIPPGEFVIGLPGAEKHDPGTAAIKDMPSWMGNGSFQVIRRLEQDVPGWWAQVDTQLAKLKAEKAVPEDTSTEWLAARLVGRWRSGASVAKCPVKPTNTLDAAPDNDLSFRDDPDGLTTPLFSHLRATNPRDGLIDPSANPKEVPETFMDARRIMRRGVPYGKPFDPTSDDDGCGPDASRGLLFVCYQSDLVGQFEFIQRKWINNPDFPPGREHKPGPDPMVSGRLADLNDGQVNYESSTDGVRRTTALDFRPFVRTRGALYAFTPSISALRLLAEGRIPGGAQNLPVDAVLPLPDSETEGWTFEHGTIRRIRVETDDVDASTRPVIQTVGPLAAWPALRGVSRIDAILPVPDEQNTGGRSSYWLFHTVAGRQVYRRIVLLDHDPYTSDVVGEDQPLSRWASFDGVSHVDAVLPVPGEQHINATNHYYLFHTTGEGQRFRIISVAEDPQHPDRKERDDRPLSAWSSLEGVTGIDAFHPIPGRHNVRGESRFWAFHGDRFRVIGIARAPHHTDTLIHDDRPTNAWFRTR
jgi:Dyp-type peroxidase family